MVPPSFFVCFLATYIFRPSVVVNKQNNIRTSSKFFVMVISSSLHYEFKYHSSLLFILQETGRTIYKVSGNYQESNLTLFIHLSFSFNTNCIILKQGETTHCIPWYEMRRDEQQRKSNILCSNTPQIPTKQTRDSKYRCTCVTLWYRAVFERYLVLYNSICPLN